MNILRSITSITSPRRMTVISLYVVVLFAILIPFNGSAQTMDSVLVIKPETQSLDVAQIPEFAQKTRKLIIDIQRKTTTNEDLMEISAGISEVLNILAEKDTLLSDSLNQYRLDHFDKEDRQLSLLKVRLKQWKTTIEDITRDGLENDSIALSMIKVWQITLDTINAVQETNTVLNIGTESSNDLKAEIINFIADIQISQKSLSIYLDTVQHIQTEIAIAENKLGNISDLIESKRSYLKQNIWLAESPPIWEIKRDTIETSKTLNFADYINSDWSIIKAFFKNNPKLPYYFAIFFLIIFGIIIYLIPKAKELYVNFPEEFKEAGIILKYPFLAALLITWFSPLIFSYFPKELGDLVALIMLLPLVFMLSKLIPAWKWYSVVLFSCTYLLFLFFNEFDYTYFPQRLFLIIVNILAIALFYFYKKHNQFEQLNKGLYGTLPFLTNLFILFGTISLLASVFGAIQLAKLLVHAILGIILTIYVIETVISLVKNFLFFSFNLL